MKKLLAAAVILAALGFGSVIGTAPHASADMCGPAGYPVLGLLNPWIKSCAVYVPGAGALPQIPVVTQPVPPSQYPWVSGPVQPNQPYYQFPWGSFIPGH